MNFVRYARMAALILLSIGTFIYPLPAMAERFTVTDIRVNGLQRVSAGTIFSVLPISVGDDVEEKQLAQAARTLFKTGFFDDIQLLRDGEVLVIQVTERPSISEITFDGNKSIKTEDLRKGLSEMGMQEGQVFQRATLERLTIELKRQYVSQGRYGVQVDADVIAQPRNRVAVHIRLQEGPVASIDDINLVGNQVFEDEELLKLFELKQPGLLSWYTKDDQYSREKFGGDLERLRSFYLDRGYINFTVESTQVSITPEKDRVYLTINISEGQQFKVREVKLAGELVVPEEELRLLLVMRKDQIFSRQLLTLTSDLLTKRLGNEGYTFANVNGIPEIHDEDDTVSVTFFVDPGKRSYVRRINFRGNTRTADNVLRREMVQLEGGWASTEKVEQSKTRLERLGYFKNVNVETKPVPGTSDQVDVEYSVDEQPSGSISASVGFAQGSGLILGGSISQNNFLGTGNQVSAAINTSSFRTQYSFSYLNPYYTLDGISRGFNVFYRETDFDAGNITGFSTDALGGGVTFGYPINFSDRIFFRTGFTSTALNAGTFPSAEIAGFIAKEGKDYNVLNMETGWSRNRLNRTLLPTSGSRQNLGMEISVPGSDLQYYKLSYNGEKYFPLNRDFTFRLRTDLGYGDGYGSGGGLPFFENYYAGGISSVRGYESNTLGPRDTPNPASGDTPDPFGGNVLIAGSAEVLFPIPFLRDQQGLRGSFFLDGGNVFLTDRPGGGASTNDDDVSFSNLRFSVGFGINWLTGFGPLSFAIAAPINSESGDDTQAFQFSFGQAF